MVSLSEEEQRNNPFKIFKLISEKTGRAGRIVLLFFLFSLICILVNSVWFPAKRRITKAIIVELKSIPVKKGFQQKITYAYSFMDSLYFDSKQISSLNGSKRVGASLEISFSEKQPDNSSINHFYKPTDSSPARRYFWSDKMGNYAYLSFHNGLCILEEFGDRGKLLSKSYFRAVSGLDKDLIYPLFPEGSKRPIINFQHKNLDLFDSASNRLYGLSEDWQIEIP